MDTALCIQAAMACLGCFARQQCQVCIGQLCKIHHASVQCVCVYVCVYVCLALQEAELAVSTGSRGDDVIINYMYAATRSEDVCFFFLNS